MIEINLHHPEQMSLTKLKDHVSRQLDFLGWDTGSAEGYSNAVEAAVERTGRCFSRLKNKYYNRNGVAIMSPGHTGHYAIYLYYLSYAMKVVGGDVQLASGIYALNKMLHCVDLYFEVELPDVFYLDHPLGSVIGRASFSDCFQFRQNCTVGNNKGIFPVFGKNVQMWSGVTVVGNCKVGDHVTFASGTYVKDTDIPDYSLVFGRSPNLVIKERQPEQAAQSAYFHLENL